MATYRVKISMYSFTWEGEAKSKEQARDKAEEEYAARVDEPEYEFFRIDKNGKAIFLE